MLRLVIGVEPRCKLGGDLERALRYDYGFDLTEFEVLPIDVSGDLNQIALIEQAAETILHKAYDAPPARFYGAVAGGEVKIKAGNTTLCMPYHTLNLVSAEGAECLVYTAPLAQRMPWRKRRELYNNPPPDLIDTLAHHLTQTMAANPVL